jgi:hypothetical protein
MHTLKNSILMNKTKSFKYSFLEKDFFVMKQNQKALKMKKAIKTSTRTL